VFSQKEVTGSSRQVQRLYDGNKRYQNVRAISRGTVTLSDEM
jgi:hypothetical protein